MLNAVNEVARSGAPVKFSEKQLRNFWHKVEKHGPNECWVWTGSRDATDYGQFGVNGKMVGAHRMSWQIHSGAIPVGLCVCHKCDNPPCVNPSHLWLGTILDNILDKERKGRGKQPEGEAHHRSELTRVQVDAIRSIYAAGGTTQSEIGKQFGVSRSTIFDIVARKTWNGGTL